VVAEPLKKKGEVPCAFVELKDGGSATESELIEHCRARLAHYKAPRRVVFGPLRVDWVSAGAAVWPLGPRNRLGARQV